jgi:hypothetical protein
MLGFHDGPQTVLIFEDHAGLDRVGVDFHEIRLVKEIGIPLGALLPVTPRKGKGA